MFWGNFVSGTLPMDTKGILPRTEHLVAARIGALLLPKQWAWLGVRSCRGQWALPAHSSGWTQPSRLETIARPATASHAGFSKEFRKHMGPADAQQ